MDLIRKCDFCDKQAAYDGKTKMGPWAYMCPACIQKYGYPHSCMNTQIVPAIQSTRFNKENEHDCN